MKDLPRTAEVRHLSSVPRGGVIEGIEAKEISRITGIDENDELSMREWCSKNAAYFYAPVDNFNFDDAAQKTADRGLSRVVFFRHKI